MTSDEEQIRALVETWHRASRAGDTVTVLGQMTDDVVFLVPGCAPMGKADFAAASRPQPGTMPAIEGVSDIQEVVIAGEWAFMWTRLAVTVTPADGRPVVARSGHTLSVLRKVGGR